MLGKSIAITGGVSLVLLIAMMQFTTPGTIGPLGLLFVFILMYAIMVSLLTFFLYSASRVLSGISQTVTSRRPLRALSLQRSYYYGSVVALAPVMLVGMQSVSAVGFYEVLLIILFVVFACIYIAKRGD